MTTVSRDSTGCVHCFIRVGLTIHLQGEVLVLRLPLGLEADSCGKGPANLVGWNKGRSPIHQLLHLFVLLSEVLDPFFILPGCLFMGLLHLCQFPLKSQHHCCLICFGHPLTCHTVGRYHLLLFLHTLLSAPRWAPIVLERVLNFHFRLVYNTPSYGTPSSSRSSGSTGGDGTCRRHSNAQVSRGVNTQMSEYYR